MKRTKNIPVSVLKDALGVAGGIYRMNAPNACGYAFNAGVKEVTTGEFVYPQEKERCLHEYDGYIDFAKKTLTDNISGEVVGL